MQILLKIIFLDNFTYTEGQAEMQLIKLFIYLFIIGIHSSHDINLLTSVLVLVWPCYIQPFQELPVLTEC